jgi:hypothetical protein
LIALLGFCAISYSQSADIVLSGKIVNAQNKEVVPYANIYNKNSGKGAISNDNGAFNLSGLSNGDTLVISYVGFERQVFIVTVNNANLLLKMKPKAQELGAFVITANNSYLYHLISRCSKNSKSTARKAKTYFSLESTVNGEQVEMVESYYNGTYKNGDVSQLELKQGRIALAPFDRKFFVSTETSKALNMHHLFAENAHFPGALFELNKKRLSKIYDLSLSTKFLNEEGSPIIVIDFVPKENVDENFYGRVWIDSLSAQVLKVNLNVLDAENHPFLPLGNVDSLKQVTLSITKTYQSINNEMTINSVDFNYQVKYVTHQKQYVEVATKAILYAYDYQTQFNLPFFKFTTSMYEDYRKINATPYNQFFWQNINEFGMKDVKESNQKFLKSHSSLMNQNIFIGTEYLKNGIFEQPYVSWSENRIALKSSSSEPTFYKAQLGSTPSEKYNLSAQIYCDINLLNDSLNVITSTVFDPFDSFYYYEMDANGAAFINMYFDLVEIERQDFLQSIKTKTKRSEVEQAYLFSKQKLEIELKIFLKEVQRGTNEEGMVKWNAFILRNLKIDNLVQFGLFEN